jgi:hypothetical protein
VTRERVLKAEGEFTTCPDTPTPDGMLSLSRLSQRRGMSGVRVAVTNPARSPFARARTLRLVAPLWGSIRANPRENATATDQDRQR